MKGKELYSSSHTVFMFVDERLVVLNLPNFIPRELEQKPSSYLDSFNEPETIERNSSDNDLVNDVGFDEI